MIGRPYRTAAVVASLLATEASCFVGFERPTLAWVLRAEKKEGQGYQFGDLFLNKMGRRITGNSEYKFGDITKNVGKSLTGKDEYQFGDISRWLDSKAKAVVNEATGKEEYEFGDLSVYLDGLAKRKVNEFTKKDEYVVGDISKEVLRRAVTGEYEVKDIFLLLRVLASFGVNVFAPVAGSLPAHFLLEMYNYSLEWDLAGRLLEFLAKALDERFKEALTGDKAYQLGDMTKRSVMGLLGKTPDAEYQIGDFTRAVKARLESPTTAPLGHEVAPFTSTTLKDLEKLDKATGVTN